MSDIDAQKQAAGEAAAKLVEPHCEPASKSR